MNHKTNNLLSINDKICMYFLNNSIQYLPKFAQNIKTNNNDQQTAT